MHVVPLLAARIPAGQGVQLVEPLSGAMLDPAHGMQLVAAPSPVGAQDPAGHSSHDTSGRMLVDSAMNSARLLTKNGIGWGTASANGAICSHEIE